MARQPSYPKDAPVASAKDEASATSEPTSSPAPTPGEGAAGESKRTKHLVTGAAIGIGSAAIVAALLYAKRRNRG